MEAAFILFTLWVFWLLYVFTMGLYRAFLSRRLKGLALVMCAPIVAVAFIIDVVVQMTLSTILFLDLPRDLFVTGRFRRYRKQGKGWRFDFSEYICKHLLDPFDPTGAHCDDEKPVLKG